MTAPSIDELAIEATSAEIRRASDWVSTACQGRAVPERSAERLVMCLNEIVANVVAHGGASARSAPVMLVLHVASGPGSGEASLTVSDAGRAFDPTTAPEAALPKTLDEAAGGGRGLRIVRRCADWLGYRNEAGRNHVTFGTRWGASAAAPPHAHFRRGPDRRVADLPVAAERRRSERRCQVVQWIDLFRDADPLEVEEAVGECEVLQLPAGTTLLRRGESNRNVFILLSGRLEARLGEDGGADNAVAFAPGECIGELSAIDGKPISARVHAVSDARVLRLDRDVFWNRLIPLRGVAANLMSTLTERMRRTNDKALAVQRERLELQHLRKELDLARQLQASMLPLQRPLFPWRSDIEVCGFMEPASKVGGDLFDVFFVDSRTLFLCIGDVSGHGIAAALFMVRVMGLLRTLATDGMRPDQVLETLNDRLCIGNDTNLFVTLFCGFLDVQDGRFVHSNAGHCVPMIRSGGEVRRLAAPKGALLGAAGARRYASAECELAVGDTLFCYSDGITEAHDAAGREVTDEGCLEWLREARASDTGSLLDGMFERVVAHTGSRVPADDCTMLAVRRLAGA